jgi:putative ABC transport system ATP-binding protein
MSTVMRRDGAAPRGARPVPMSSSASIDTRPGVLAPARGHVRAEGLGLAYDDGRTRALDGVDLEIRRGEFVAITGPSGCGKSSLLNLIGLLDAPTSGRLFLDDEPYEAVRDAALFRRRHFGFVFQAFHLIPTLTALENVLVPTIGVKERRQDGIERAWQLLADMGLDARANHLPSQLSGGERQRVAVARALVNGPGILVADEPTGSLDSAAARQVLERIAAARARAGLTVVMVTHDASVSARADRIVRLRDGRLDAAWGGAS